MGPRNCVLLRSTTAADRPSRRRPVDAHPRDPRRAPRLAHHDHKTEGWVHWFNQVLRVELRQLGGLPASYISYTFASIDLTAAIDEFIPATDSQIE
jgi:hypothetical protein